MSKDIFGGSFGLCASLNAPARLAGYLPAPPHPDPLAARPPHPTPIRANVPLVASDRPKATFAHIGVTGDHDKWPSRRSLGPRAGLPDAHYGPLTHVSLVRRNLAVDDGKVVLHRRNPGSNQHLMLL